MTQSELSDQRSIELLVSGVLDDAGVNGALAEALILAQLEGLPPHRDQFVQFIETRLFEALLGRVHPATARALVTDILDGTAQSQSGTRRRPPSTPLPLMDPPSIQPAPIPPHNAPTVPPPSPESVQTYQDLVSGAVHTRATPVWGLRRSEPGGSASLWVIVSEHAELIGESHRSAPAKTEIVIVDSVATLKNVLTREDRPLTSVVIDATDPSIPFDRVIATLTEEPVKARVIVWRMTDEKSGQLARAVPMTRGWLHFEDEVTPVEIVQLLGA